MIDFSLELEQRVSDLIFAAVGPAADAPNVITFDDHLHDVDRSQLPFIVVTTRSAEEGAVQEIGSNWGPKTYTVHVYYLDIADTYAEGKLRRANILSRVRKALEPQFNLGNMESVDDDGTREYVFDSGITTILFDSSGQDQYYSFVSELYLEVQTATTQ